MSSMDLRSGINAVSDVILNRPAPLREFDQIYMKAADMLLQAEHVARVFDNKNVVFIGDGDSIGLCAIYLGFKEIINHKIKHIHILDFDERIVLSIQNFAQKYSLSKKISSELYNVASPLPKEHWQKFDGFYTNPPYGSTNSGRSIEAFIQRGIEAIKNNGMGYMVIADYPQLAWTQELMYSTENFLIENNFLISEIIPEFHTYHLDDNPELTSCSLVAKLMKVKGKKYLSQPLNEDALKNFYGEKNPLRTKYVKDLTNGGKLISKDHVLIPLEGIKNV